MALEDTAWLLANSRATTVTEIHHFSLGYDGRKEISRLEKEKNWVIEREYLPNKKGTAIYKLVKIGETSFVRSRYDWTGFLRQHPELRVQQMRLI